MRYHCLNNSRPRSIMSNTSHQATDDGLVTWAPGIYWKSLSQLCLWDVSGDCGVYSTFSMNLHGSLSIQDAPTQIRYDSWLTTFFYSCYISVRVWPNHMKLPYSSTAPSSLCGQTNKFYSGHLHGKNEGFLQRGLNILSWTRVRKILCEFVQFLVLSMWVQVPVNW